MGDFARLSGFERELWINWLCFSRLGSAFVYTIRYVQRKCRDLNAFCSDCQNFGFIGPISAIKHMKGHTTCKDSLTCFS